jgi:hypothetical protein
MQNAYGVLEKNINKQIVKIPYGKGRLVLIPKMPQGGIFNKRDSKGSNDPLAMRFGGEQPPK